MFSFNSATVVIADNNFLLSVNPKIKVFVTPSHLPPALKWLQKRGMRNTDYLICLFPLCALFLIFKKGTRSKNGETVLASSNTGRIPIKPDENLRRCTLSSRKKKNNNHILLRLTGKASSLSPLHRCLAAGRLHSRC